MLKNQSVLKLFVIDRGLYLHIPFCRKKCAYCDFYSSFVNETLIDEYVNALTDEIIKWSKTETLSFDSIYLGGGTPSLLGKRILPLLETVFSAFNIKSGCEITAEMNPTGDSSEFLKAAKLAGVNRLSMGVQSGIDSELKLLGRTHTAKEAAEAVKLAKSLGFSNISLDLMIGLPYSSNETLKKSIDYILGLNPEHISSYILKVEPNTAFGKSDLPFADDDEQANQYLYMCEEFEKAGYGHYEISNFAKPGFESRHNLKYWKTQEYLGIGPSAHSFLKGKRFYYPRNLKTFMNNPETVADGDGGYEEEKIMLGLRLREGVDLGAYPEAIPLLLNLEKAGLGKFENSMFSLTDKGMLVSNSIIAEISERIL